MTAARRLVVLGTFCLATAVLSQGPGAPLSGTAGPPEERRVYVVFFEEKPLATYRGTIPGLAATHPRSRGERRLDPDSPASRAYLRFLESRQDNRLRAALGRRPQLLHRYLAAGNAVALRLSPAEASVISGVPGVVRAVEDYVQPLDTDRGPAFIGAPGIWDGSDSGGTPTLGEGVIVGIIDTGVNMLHPSFSDTPVDGHVYTNPLGSGNFLGWCDPSHPNHQASFVCNDKLIGAWDFADAVSVDNDGPEDSDGHGSHTASTAAGNLLDYTEDGVPDLSGVAPHANLITYDACYVDPGSGQGLCPFSAASAAVNQAILDGVQVVNYSISGGTVPWSDIDAFFLNAVAAGMFVATSAGNSGPAAGTVGHLGPWVSSVAANTHDRVQSENSLVNMSGGASPPGPPADMDGLSRTGGYGPAPMVYAGDFSNGSANPEQCLVPFAPGTWSGEIVVCERGGIARVMKGQNVFLGGAGALVLANVAGGTAILADDPHLIPGIHVSQADGDTLRTWLASGSLHTATITASTLVTDPALGDITASFSSRGPNPAFDVLKPDLTNPGVDILAAVAADFFDEVGLPPYQGLTIFFLDGTSMSSPHTAGAGALLRALHPSWTPLEVKSALMTTAQPNLLKENGATPADAFDVGAGRVDLSRAGRAGLLFDETQANFLAADPSSGGDPATLNIPSLMSSACAATCSWTRTAKSSLATSVTWTASFSGPSWMTITVHPSSFPLAPGASQTLNIEVAGAALGTVGVWAFGQLTLTPDDSSVPEAHLPVAVLPAPTPELVLDAIQVDDTLGNADGIADPHEIITLALDLRNVGSGGASSVVGTLTGTTPGITILDGSSIWPSIASSAVRGSQMPHFQFQIDGSVPCGTLIDFDLDVSTAQGPFSLSFQQEVGLSEDPSGLYLSQGEALAIPDSDPGGVESSIVVSDSFPIEDIQVAVNITHPRIGDLEVDLTSPGGTTVRLHDGSGADGDDIITTYDLVTTPDGPGSLSDFDGEEVNGTWTLKVVDAASNNVGQLNNWSLDVDGVFSLTCAPVPCTVFAQATVNPGLVCPGSPSSLSGVGTIELGEDCGATLEYRFSDAGLIQDWSMDPDAVVSPTVTTLYNVDVRDAATLALDTATVALNVLPAPQPTIVQTPGVLCAEGGSVDLDAGAGFVSYSWEDDSATVVGTEQVLLLGVEACGRTYTVMVEGVNGCSAPESQLTVCQVCTPPEVSGAGTVVPLRLGLDAAGTIEFELLPDPDVTYNLYQAITKAEVLAGDWTHKFCDLSTSALGTWTPVGPDTVRWTPMAPSFIVEGHLVVVAERFGFEGSFGPRPSDADGAGSATSICP